MTAIEPATPAPAFALGCAGTERQLHLARGLDAASRSETLGGHEEAIARYEAALALRPGHPDITSNIVILLHKLGRFEESIAQCDRTLAINPGDAQTHNNRGVGLLALGRIAAAGEAFERAVALAPRRAEFHFNLATVRRFTAGDRRLDGLEALATDLAALPDNDRVAVHFALGRAYGDLGEHARSFRHLIAGNALKRRQIQYDEAAHLDLFARIAQVFTPGLMARKRGGGDPSDVPVLIVGLPRSGTTLIEQILASHSRVHGAGELDEFRAAAASIPRPNGMRLLDHLPAISGEELRAIGADYVRRLRRRSAGTARIVDKMPSNFAFAGLAHLALPKARIIHARRDPVDTCLSCFSLLFASEHPYAYDLGELGRYYRSYQALMAHWRRVLPDGVMLEVRYEDVVDDLEGQGRRILAHCGLEWEDACLAFHETRRPVQTASAMQVRQPIYRTSVGRWHAYKDLLTPLLRELGRPAQ
jgi:tetratricopeptide (TPR) repeat protein